MMLLAIPPLLGVATVGKLWRDLRGSLRAYGVLGMVLIPLTAVLHSVYTPIGAGQTVLLAISGPETPIIGGFYLTRQAVEFSLIIYLRLVLMLLAVSVFIKTTSLDDLQALLLKLRIPYFFVLTLGFAFRFLPTLADEAQRIREAQMARGLDLEKGNAFGRYWRGVVPLVFPLMVGVLRKALLFAEALEARGTFAYPRRTSLTVLTFGRGDVVAVSLSLFLLGLAFFYLVIQPVF